MTQQNVIAKEIATDALENAGDWYRNQIDDMLKLFPTNKYGQVEEKDKKEYEALQELAGYPCYLINSATWEKVFKGAIAKVGVLSQIESFYENYYAMFGEELRQMEYATTIPLLLTAKSKDLLDGVIYPVIATNEAGKSCIILVLNEDE